MPKRAKGRQFPVEISAVAWIDLLGYGSMLRSVNFDPSHERAQAAVDRLKRFQQTAAMHTTRLLRALIVNDGVAYVRELSPRTRSVTFDFIQRVFNAYREINSIDQEAQHPGARMVVAVGPRLRMPGSTRFNRAHLKSLLTRLKKGVISPEQAVLEAFTTSPLAGSTVPLQANFAFTKAYLVDDSGSAAGFSGPKFYLDREFFDGVPDWLLCTRSVDWLTEGMRGSFFDVNGIDAKRAGRKQYSGVRDAEEIADALGVDFSPVQRVSHRTYAGDAPLY